MSRFMSAIKVGEDETPKWAQRYFADLMTCLEQDYLHGAKFTSLMHRGQDSFDRSTSSKKDTLDNALLRSCQNHLAVACLIFADVTNQHRQRAINAVCKGVKRWHEHQASELRSCDQPFSWLMAQQEGVSSI